MTERALLVRHATTADGRFAAVGIEHAAVRVFETSTGALVAECAVRGHRELLLASTALGYVAEQATVPFVALGTTCGRVIVHDCAKDATVANVVVHDASTPIVGVAFSGPHVVALSATGRVSVLRAATGAVVSSKLRTVGRASALGIGAVAAGPSATSATLSVAVASSGACGVFTLAAGGASAEASLDEVCTFSGHVASPDYCAIVGNGAACLTATFGDGTIRLWDARPSIVGSRAAGDDRCRAHMPCDHRLVAVDVFEHTVSSTVDGVTTSELRTELFATTVTGEVMHFRFAAEKLANAAAAASAPLRPIGRLASLAPNGRVLLAKPTPLPANTTNNDTTAGVGMLAIRGRWGTPAFDNVDPTLIADATRRTQRAAASTAAKAPSTVTKLPFLDDARATAPSDHIVLNEKKLKRKAMIAGATVVDGSVVAANDAPIPLAKSIEDLPVSAGGGKVLSLAAAEEQMKRKMEGAADEDEATLDAAVAEDAAALGAEGGSGVVVMLHQALHAKDASMVTELVMLAARTHADMVATVRGLRIAYLAQLMKIMADRIATAGASSPLHGWVHVVLRERGVEIQRCVAAAAASEESSAADVDPTEAAVGRAFKAVLAPILAQYRRLSALRDSVSVLHGRSSVFLSTRAANGKTGFRNNFVEPRSVFGTKPTRVSAVGVTADDGASDDEAEDGEPRRRRHLSAAARRRKGKKEPLMLDDASDDENADDDDAVLAGHRGGRAGRGLDDAMDSDEDGDDGSSAFGDEDGFDDDEEGGAMEGDEEEEGDDDDFSLDDDDIGGIGSAGSGAEDDDEEGGLEDDESDLAPSDDFGGDEEDEEEAEGDDASVEYESGGSGDSDDDVAEINNAHKSRRSGQLVVDADEGDEPDDE
mmetsp:Transcript_25921/g.80090  ORF Transcript_25921/g.80090 Transcript_25921/m.80090 type:complete len:880 (-) Transcript_25921:104-2743(-)